MRQAAKETKPVTVRLPVELIRAAKHYAVDQGKALQDVLTEALAAYLAKKGAK